MRSSGRRTRRARRSTPALKAFPTKRSCVFFPFQEPDMFRSVGAPPADYDSCAVLTERNVSISLNDTAGELVQFNTYLQPSISSADLAVQINIGSLHAISFKREGFNVHNSKLNERNGCHGRHSKLEQEGPPFRPFWQATRFVSHSVARGAWSRSLCFFQSYLCFIKRSD